MVTLTRPAPTPLLGNYNWVYVPTIASQAAPTVSEITSASSLDVTAILFTSSAAPSQSTNQVSAAQRMADIQTYQRPGLTTLSWGDLHYAFNPQATTTGTAWAIFGSGAGTTGFMVYRAGIANTTAFATTQKVSVYPVGIGPGLPVPEGDGEAAEQAVTQTVSITGPITVLAAVS